MWIAIKWVATGIVSVLVIHALTRMTQQTSDPTFDSLPRDKQQRIENQVYDDVIRDLESRHLDLSISRPSDDPETIGRQLEEETDRLEGDRQLPSDKENGDLPSSHDHGTSNASQGQTQTDDGTVGTVVPTTSKSRAEYRRQYHDRMLLDITDVPVSLKREVLDFFEDDLPMASSLHDRGVFLDPSDMATIREAWSNEKWNRLQEDARYVTDAG